MPTHVAIPGNDMPLLNVRAPEDIEFLLKESEVLTGKPGHIRHRRCRPPELPGAVAPDGLQSRAA
jgi:hypothetical protein